MKVDKITITQGLSTEELCARYKMALEAITRVGWDGSFESFLTAKNIANQALKE